MALEQVVFDETLENLLRAYRKRLTPALTDRLKAIGVDPTAKLKPQYPRAVHDHIVKLLADEYHPGKSTDAATYEVGADAIRVLDQSVLSRTLIRVLRLLPHSQALKRLPTVFRTGNNYLDVKVNQTAPLAYELDMNEAGAWPHYWLGLMHTANVNLFGYKRAIIALRSYDGHRAVVFIDLDPPK
jgi:uncharacterized protein (TIGR02265 family)